MRRREAINQGKNTDLLRFLLNKLPSKRAVHFSQFVHYKLYSKTDVFRTRSTVTAFDGLILKNSSCTKEFELATLN